MSSLPSILHKLLLKLQINLTNSIFGEEDYESTLNSDSLPPELLTHILSFVHPRDLVRNCRLVCRYWNQLITENGSEVWKRGLQQSNSKSLSEFNDFQRRRLKLPWYVCCQICLQKDPFEKNLLRNNCGRWVPDYYPELRHSQFEHWELLLHDELRCFVYRYPSTYHPFPQSEDFGELRGFRTSFITTTKLKKQQTIDLQEHGLTRLLMDEIQPKIIASEWFSGSGTADDVPGADPEYALKVSLLSSDGQSVIQQKEVLSNVEDWEEDKWKKVTLEFENYGPDVRYVVFYHYAKDFEFDGMGTYMAGGVVKVALPTPPDSSTVIT